MIYITIIVLLLAIIICLGIYTYKLRKSQWEIISINQQTIEEQRTIERDILIKQEQLNRIADSIQSQNNILQSLKATSENLRLGAEEQAQKDYEARIAALKLDYEKEENILKANYSELATYYTKQLAIAQCNLEDVEAKQLAYLEAQKRQEEINAQQDYYRLAIDEIDLEDIALLRELQFRFVKKDIIDKLIWEVYYKPAYDILMSHLFSTSSKVCGIYKITDLITGQAYVGQSVDIKERFRQHIKSALTYGKATNKLYQTMQKSGLYNFTFEILEQISRDKLNERETYWINFYKTRDYGLNSTRGGS